MSELKQAIMNLVPADGSAIGNRALLEQLQQQGHDIDQAEYESARDELVASGQLAKGRGKGGSIKRNAPSDDDFSLEEVVAENESSGKSGKKKASKKKTQSKSRSMGQKQVLSYRYDDKRKNNPHVGMVDTTSDAVEEEKSWRYDPHIDPALQFDIGRSEIEKLIDDALASGDQAVMQSALERLKKMSEPYLNWTSKAERTSFDVDTVSLHVHERIDPATILAAVQKRIKSEKSKGNGTEFQPDLFSAPFENLPLREAIDFYKHERDWANRLIAGDSLLVMNSLLQKESMAGQVQMIYIDPPYGIKYGSNFQPFVNKRDVKDRRDEDLTSEPEMIRAFRDTWELGIHSYLTYLRDRLLLARELLHESGSIFVQISDENLHHVREITKEIFGEDNFISTIRFRRGGFQTSTFLPETYDFVLWFSKNKEKAKFNRIYKTATREEAFPGQQLFAEFEDGSVEKIDRSNIPLHTKKIFRHRAAYSASGSDASRFEVTYQGNYFKPSGARGWSTNKQGMSRLAKSRRLFPMGNTLERKMYFEDSPFQYLTTSWDDSVSSGFGDQKLYVVQTQTLVIQRCILMTTDPGDLVFDPTCGSGATACVAELWGRRWITCDTSRVAVTLSKQRLMTASYDYYELKYPHEGIKGGFIYEQASHITLKSITNNPDIDDIYDQMHPAIESALSDLNKSLKGQKIQYKVTEGGRKGKSVDFSAKDSETMELPSGDTVRVNELLEWEVPFEFPEDWPEQARKPFDAFHAARRAMQEKIDASIATHAEQETLYDQPQVSKDKLRITGPFTVEAVPFATVLGLEEAEQPSSADVAVARSGETSRQSQWRDELLKTGIRGRNGQKMQLAELETLPGTRYIHAIGTVADTGDRVAVSFGPEYAALEQRQVEIAMREAGDLFPLPKILVFCAFTFDPEAAKDIDNIKGITAIKVQMNTDLLTEDLKKARSNNESFWLMGQPDVDVRKQKDGRYVVEVNGFDYFDTKTGELESGGKKKIAMWELDTDYDDRSLYPRQIFFPMAGSKDGWFKLKKDIRAELNEDLLEQFHGTVSLPFEAGDNGRIAVKIVDDRGIESLKVIDLE